MDGRGRFTVQTVNRGLTITFNIVTKKDGRGRTVQTVNRVLTITFNLSPRRMVEAELYRQ